MVTPPDIEAQILRYYHAEKWTAGTIARQLHVHHSVVRRVLAQAGLPPRTSQIDAYVPLIRETLEKFPTLTASRLYAMIRERGYRGSGDHFRHLIACYRPRPAAEAYLRLRSLPGEQAQVDWGHFGHLQIGRARRLLMACVMVLNYSRQIFLRFFLDARMESFLRGHVGAFTAWGGVPRVLLYDNLKSAVLERRGDAIRFIQAYLPLPDSIASSPGRSQWPAATRRAGSSVPSATCAARSSPPANSPVSTISMPRPPTGAAAWPPTGAVPVNPTARCARCSPTRCRVCCRCRTTPRRCSNASRSRSARHRMSAST